MQSYTTDRLLNASLVVVVLICAGIWAGVVRAAVPPSRAGVAIVDVKVGGDRETPTTVTPAAGITFGLFKAEPTSFEPVGGFATTPPLYTCVSDGEGDCAFEVPLGSGGVTEGTRLWVAPVAGPLGEWFANPVWQTAPLTGTTGRNLTRHVFQTPSLYSGQRYVSGSGGFMGEPGTQTSPSNPTSEYTRRIDSSGVWPLSRVDPPLSEQCGLNVAFVVDLSSSMNGSVGALKGAMDSFVGSLRGTPSEASLFTFSTDTPAVKAGPNSSLIPVVTEADAKRFKALYSSWNNSTANGYTNWDRGLAAVAAVNANPEPAQHFNLVVLLTDGNPTDYGPVSGEKVPNRSGYTRFRELENAVASANLVKSQGTRILAVGVGEGLDEGADRNLRSISGQVGYSPTTPIGEVGYFRTENYEAVSERLRELFLEPCAPSVSVVKQILPAGSGGDISKAFTPSEPWEFVAHTTTPGATVAPEEEFTNPLTGALNFDLTFDPADSPAGITIHENPSAEQAGYVPIQNGGENATCVNKSAKSGGEPPVPVTNEPGPNGFHISVGTEDIISCVVYNEEPPPAPAAPPPASVVVDKEWKVKTAAGTATYEEGGQPANLQGYLEMDGPASAPPSGQPWGVERTSYVEGDEVTLSESTELGLPGCSLTTVTATGPGLSSTALSPTEPTTTATLGPGVNSYTVTNEVECHSRLVLLKEVLGGSADPAAWTLRAIGPVGEEPIVGPSGTEEEVGDGITYQLAEEPNPSDPSLLDYAQFDYRERPLQFPLSSGSMRCNVLSGPAPGETALGGSYGGEGNVVVPMGQDVACVAVNQTGQLTLVKQVVGGTAAPGDFSFTVTPVNPAVAGLSTKQVKGAAAPGTTIDVRPGQQYRITESGPGGYTLTSLTCDVGGTEQSGDTLAIPAGAAATCTATNTFPTSSAPPPGEGQHHKKKHKHHKGKSTRGRLAIRKTADRAKARPGRRIAYRIVVRSLGPATARSVRVCDRFPDALVLLGAPGAHEDHGQPCWATPKLRPGAKRVYKVEAAVPRLTATRTVRNVAVVDGKNVDPEKASAGVRLVAPRPEPPRFTG
ncbi:MAG TPA: VWA domain-containing protein [Solirubrobacterales bacterium]|nr:VWA domain-containing protein [Solirubrobacterales bacterium]